MLFHPRVCFQFYIRFKWWIDWFHQYSLYQCSSYYLECARSSTKNKRGWLSTVAIKLFGLKYDAKPRLNGVSCLSCRLSRQWHSTYMSNMIKINLNLWNLFNERIQIVHRGACKFKSLLVTLIRCINLLGLSNTRNREGYERSCMISDICQGRYLGWTWKPRS